VAIIMRIIQRFQTAKKIEFMELEKQFATLEHQGILLKGERMTPLASREPGNTLIWQRRFRNLGEAEEALRFFQNNADHTRLYEQQKQYMEDTWVEFYEVLDC
jgi:4-hydroxyphenylpyruvate dioxygenase-like putative hemolysin